MRSKNFIDLDTAANYLMNSVVRVGSYPIYIKQVSVGVHDHNWKITYNKLGSEDLEMTFLPNETIDLNPIPLGLFNTKTSIGKASRIPSRSWKIGLSYSNASILWNSYREETPLENFFMSNTLRDIVMNLYPLYENAIAEVSGKEVKARAFSRKFAVNNNGEIIYKREMKKIGTFCPDNGIPILLAEYNHLRESLQEDIP